MGFGKRPLLVGQSKGDGARVVVGLVVTGFGVVVVGSSETERRGESLVTCGIFKLIDGWTEIV